MSVVNETIGVNGRVTNETLNIHSNVNVHGEYLEFESNQFSESIYGQRMIDYYPKVISCIQEFRAIIRGEYPEFESLNSSQQKALNDAYLTTMGEERIIEWEKILAIKPLESSTIDQRRDTVIARIRGQGKLNTALISSIVNAFTGGTAVSYIQDSCLYVEISPPPTNKQFQFLDVQQELLKKIPAHLGLSVKRNYAEWQDIKDYHANWQEVMDVNDTWKDVYLYVVPFNTYIVRGINK